MTLRSKSSVQDEFEQTASAENSKSTPDVSGHAIAGSSLPQASRYSAEADRITITFEAVKRAPCLPCFTPRIRRERNPNFFGREDVFSRIDDALLPNTQACGGASASQSSPFGNGKGVLSTFALCGIGGSGKTEVAAEYAYRREQQFDAVFWVTADSKDILTEEFAHIAVALELLQQHEATDLLTACDLVKGWLSNPVKSHHAVHSPDNEAKWLLIFDNADHQDVLEDFWPTAGIGSIMVTSRDTYAKTQTYTANHGLDLTPFSIREASDMIRQLVPSDMVYGQENLIAQIAEKLGGLPLLLTQMSGLMTRLHLSCKDFLNLCEERDVEHLDWVGDDSSRSAQVFKISTNIGLDGLTPASLSVLQMASMLDPDCVPQDVLQHAFNHKSLPGLPANFRDYIDARLQLQRSSLIGINRATGDLTLHRIVQDVTLASMNHARRTDVFQATLQAVSSAWPYVELKDRFTTDRYPACAKVFPCVVRLKQAMIGTMEAEDSGDPDDAAALLNDAGW
jgi:hypothetical protein